MLNVFRRLPAWHRVALRSDVHFTPRGRYAQRRLDEEVGAPAPQASLEREHGLE